MQIRDHVGTGKPAVILHPSGTVVTFDEMEARANRLAHYFRKAGLVEGDAVAILMENNAHIHTVMWAARRAGLYYVPINIHLTPAEAAYIVDNSNAKEFSQPAFSDGYLLLGTLNHLYAYRVP